MYFRVLSTLGNVHARFLLINGQYPSEELSLLYMKMENVFVSLNFFTFSS